MCWLLTLVVSLSCGCDIPGEPEYDCDHAFKECVTECPEDHWPGRCVRNCLDDLDYCEKVILDEPVTACEVEYKKCAGVCESVSPGNLICIQHCKNAYKVCP